MTKDKAIKNTGSSPVTRVSNGLLGFSDGILFCIVFYLALPLLGRGGWLRLGGGWLDVHFNAQSGEHLFNLLVPLAANRKVCERLKYSAVKPIQFSRLLYGSLTVVDFGLTVYIALVKPGIADNQQQKNAGETG